MSRESVEWVERFFELFNRREVDAWEAMLASDIDWHVDPQDPDTTVHRGREAARQYGSMWAETMDASVQVREVFAGDNDRVAAWSRVQARGGLSGASVWQDIAFVFSLRGGLAVRVQETQDKREALEAVGLRE